MSVVVIVVGVVVVLAVALALLLWRAARAWPEDPDQDRRTDPDLYME